MVVADEFDAPATGLARLVSRLEGQRLGGLSVRVEGLEPGRLRAELTPVRPDAEGRASIWDVRLTALEDLGDEARGGALWIETDDPQAPRFEARWYYRPEG